MKFKLISTLVLLLVLGALYYVTESNKPSTPAPSGQGININ